MRNHAHLPKEKTDNQQPSGSHGKANPNYKKPMSATQIAWRVGLVIAGMTIAIILFNL